VWLARWDTDYAKFIDPKLQILSALAEYKQEKILEAVLRFLEDVDEETRFRAVGAVLAQDEATTVGALLDALECEESFRVKNRIVDGVLARGWSIPDERRAAVRKVLPPGSTIDGEGKLRKRE
jgi:HEAT repeat protein